jgi:hypothetical protein
MSSLTFERLGQLLKATMDKPDVHFFDLLAVLERLDRKNIISLLNDLLKGIEHNKKLSSIAEEHIYLYREAGVNLLIRFAGTSIPPVKLLASEVDIILMSLASIPIEIPRFSCIINKNDLAQRPEDLIKEQPIVLEPFKPYCFSAFSSILDFNNASHNAPLLIIHSEKKSWSTWAFDRLSLKALHRVSTDLRASRIQLTLLLLRTMHIKGTDALIKSLVLSDYAGQVRWEGAKYYYELNPEDAKKVLHLLAEKDSDPAVQRAAQKTLQSIK